MIVYLKLEDVLVAHRVVTGTEHDAVRDLGLLQSAVDRPSATVFGDDAYPTVWEKAAALLESLARNHGFVDGNKRTAWVATWAFLEVNGHPLADWFDQDAAEDLVLAVAQGRLDVKRVASELVKFGCG
ncbi:toxin Doc [Longimycelium tulufanense]|uniref:Toxin Doc n=1 Tax=Longimycelium tulufanense TaxID=907463 RepID=A0A8J3CD03_9PSEU|nr:type II toxin-antitoxin system death-on-curing family toxin [Longimycelium tulufanense]GGM75880.1 toxin Doc [Longimycelium tulufanense]